MPKFGQSAVGAVVAQQQAVLGAGGVQAVGLGEVAGDQVVDHHTDVGLGAPKFDRVLALRSGARR